MKLPQRVTIVEVAPRDRVARALAGPKNTT